MSQEAPSSRQGLNVFPTTRRSTSTTLTTSITRRRPKRSREHHAKRAVNKSHRECKVIFRSRALLGAVFPVSCLLCVLCAPSAQAAPAWGIAMEHHNAYGDQRASCPGGHESLPNEPDCGVDPYTGSGTTFARESGFNTYTIKVKNTAPPGVGVDAPGETVTCKAGTWKGSATFTYHWLRNGAPITGAESDTYEVTAADEGAAIQCEVIGTNEGGALTAASAAVS